MRREIAIVVEAARKQCAVVEKASNVLWDYQELLEAGASGLYQGRDHLLPPDGSSGVTSPFPGCCQQGGGKARCYQAVGQTAHFVIFTCGADRLGHDSPAFCESSGGGRSSALSSAGRYLRAVQATREDGRAASPSRKAFGGR